MTDPFRALIGNLDPARPVLVQTHDFPDHDAVGAAYGLSELLRRRNFACSIAYGGAIQSRSLTAMIDRLGIALDRLDGTRTFPNAQTIVVDGSPAGGAVKEVAGILVGVIDHHPSRKKPACPFFDLRTETGSCSAIVWTYWRDSGEIPDATTATVAQEGEQGGDHLRPFPMASNATSKIRPTMPAPRIHHQLTGRRPHP